MHFCAVCKRGDSSALRWLPPARQGVGIDLPEGDGRPGSGVSAAEGLKQAEKAVSLLRQAVALGYSSVDAFRIEAELDPLRNRADFQLLMMDIVMPESPFAP